MIQRGQVRVGIAIIIANRPFSVEKLLDQRNHFESKGGYCSQSVQQIVMQRDF